MTTRTNDFGQPIGPALPDWTAPPLLPKKLLQGQYCRVEPIDIAIHSEYLYNAILLDTEGRSWTHLAYGPFPNLKEYRDWIAATCLNDDPMFFAIVEEKAIET